MLNIQKRHRSDSLEIRSATFTRDQLDADRSKPTEEVCIYLEDWWFWGPVCVAMILLGSKLFLELSRLNDRTNLASEISNAASMWLFGAGEFRRLYLTGRTISQHWVMYVLVETPANISDGSEKNAQNLSPQTAPS